MLEKEAILKLLEILNEDIESNKKKIKLHFGNIKLINQENQNLLHIFVDNKYDEKKCFLAIKTLLELGVNPNHTSDYKYNFIQRALYSNYSEEFILKISEEAFKHGLNPNHQEEDKDTVIFTAIYSEDYFGGIEKLLQLYLKNGYDINLKCEKGHSIVEAMLSMNEDIKKDNLNVREHSKEEIKKVKELYNSATKKDNKNFFKTFDNSFNTLKGGKNNDYQNKTPIDEKLDSKVEIKEEPVQREVPVKRTESVKKVEQQVVKSISPSTLRELEKYGRVLNSKKFVSSPAVGRDEEVLRVMVSLAKEDSNPILIGESGVGKTAIADELAYRISVGAVPKILQGKIVLEIDPETLASNTKYTGEFEAKILELMRLVEANDVILLINEIHTVYGVGSSENNDRDLASIIKKYIDRGTLKVIGTTTKIEYDKYFSCDALKRRFDTVKIEEPKEELLYRILEKVMIDFTIKKGIQFKDENTMHTIIKSLIDVTKPNCRKYDDKLCNPALAISIIDEAFANAIVFEDEYIEEHHFIRATNWCERIYPTSKEKVIAKLEEKKEEKPMSRIIYFKK